MSIDAWTGAGWGLAVGLAVALTVALIVLRALWKRTKQAEPPPQADVAPFPDFGRERRAS